MSVIKSPLYTMKWFLVLFVAVNPIIAYYIDDNHCLYYTLFDVLFYTNKHKILEIDRNDS